MNRPLFLLLAIILAFPATAQPRLFTSADGATLNARQATYLDHLETLRTSAETRLVVPDLSTLDAETLTFNLLDAEVRLTRTRVERRFGDGASYRFESDDEATFALFVERQGQLTGNVRVDGQLYSVRPLTDGLHAVVKVDESQFPDDHPPEWDTVEAEAAEHWATEPYAPKALPDGIMDGERGGFAIRIMVPYTPEADQESADILGLIQLAFDETNLSYDRSNLGLEAVLAYAYKTQQSEAGADMITLLERLQNPRDSWYNEVHALRGAYGANLVNMITSDGFYCGIASAILASDATDSYAVTAQNCATGNYTFGHELGHLQGARHNPEADPSTSPFLYGHGKYYEPDAWRTIMSYNCPSGCTRRPNWSNPDVLFQGVPTGDEVLRNNARVLAETWGTIAFIGPSPTARRADVEIERLSPSTLPASGGTVQFEATITGLSTPGFAGEVWVTLTTPNGPYGTIFGPQLVRVNEDQSFSKTLQFNVPASAPSSRGGYRVSIYAGDYPDEMVSFDSFVFSKTGSNRPGEEAAPVDVTVTDEAASVLTASSTSGTPEAVALHAAYPNPFTSATTLGFEVPAAGTVQLAVYDVLGREVAVLVNGEVEAGRHTATWDATDLPSGLYLVRLTTDSGAVETQRLALVR